MHESSSSVHFWKAHSTTHWETLFIKTKVENTLKKNQNPKLVTCITSLHCRLVTSEVYTFKTTHHPPKIRVFFLGEQLDWEAVGSYSKHFFTTTTHTFTCSPQTACYPGLTLFYHLLHSSLPEQGAAQTKVFTMQASISAVCISSVLCSWSAPASSRKRTISKWPSNETDQNK